MKKIAYCTEVEIASGLIPPRILDMLSEHLGEDDLLRVKEVIGGIGGGCDDPSVPSAQWRDFIERERTVFRNKVNFLVDILNAEGDIEKLQQLFTLRLK